MLKFNQTGKESRHNLNLKNLNGCNVIICVVVFIISPDSQHYYTINKSATRNFAFVFNSPNNILKMFWSNVLKMNSIQHINNTHFFFPSPQAYIVHNFFFPTSLALNYNCCQLQMSPLWALWKKMILIFVCCESIVLRSWSWLTKNIYFFILLTAHNKIKVINKGKNMSSAAQRLGHVSQTPLLVCSETLTQNWNLTGCGCKR